MAVNLHGSHFRFGNDDGTESAHTFKANVDTNPSHDWAWASFLLRFTEQETGATAAANTDATFEYRKNAGAWTAITTASANVKAVAVAAFTNGQDCTKRLTGTGTFETTGAGCTEDGTSGGTANDIAASGNSETECGLQFVEANLADGDVIDFRLTSPDWAVTMDVVPSVTISKPTNLTAAGAIGSAEAVGIATLVLVLSLSGLPGEEALGTADVSAGANLTNAGNISGAEAFGQPGLATNLAAVGIATGALYGSPSAIEAVSATGIGTGAAYGQPGVSQTVTPTAIDTGAAYGSPALAQIITASAISGLEAFGTATVQETTEAWVYPVAIASGEAIGQHGLAAVLSPSGFAPTPAFGSPTVSETFDVTANGIDGTEAFGTATVTRDYILTRVARNAARQPIVGADVFLFDTYTKTLQGTTTTDSNGRWTFHVSGTATCYFAVMFYGNLAGVTLNTLVGA